MSALDRSLDGPSRHRDRCAFAIIAWVLFAWPSLSPAASYAEGIEAWSRVLNTYVDDQGRTDFKSLAGDTSDP